MSLTKPRVIKHPGFAGLVFFFICLCIGLGYWQLTRAHEKTIVIDSFRSRIDQPALSAAALSADQDQRFYRVQLTGHFDNDHSLLLDNKTHQGQVGYELYTPFIAEHLSPIILIDRGFIPLGKTRRLLPLIPQANQNQISGMLNFPPHHVALGAMIETQTISWPLRIEFVNLTTLAKLLGNNIYPYVVTLDQNSQAIRPTQQQIVAMGPERHRGYAFQWFALAATLLILFVLSNRTAATDK